MKVVIFAGGAGTRIAEESGVKPKPMVEVGGRPLLWHIMKIYSGHGIKDFIVCLGYKGYVIKEYFINYYIHTSDLTVDLATGAQTVHGSKSENWTVTLVDTGPSTQTGGRLKRVQPYLSDETFAVTYGDGLADIDLSTELAFHRKHGKLATVAAIQPEGRYGRLELAGEAVTNFTEKSRTEFGWVNGGFFLFEPQVLERLHPDSGPLESRLLPELAHGGELAAYQHSRFWKSCDTLRDKLELEEIWATGSPPPWLTGMTCN